MGPVELVIFVTITYLVIHLLCGCDSVLNAKNVKYVHNILYGNFSS